MGREAKTHNKLTKSQDSFVKGIVSGKTPTQSAMIAYNVSNSKSASVIASQNLNKLSIREALDEALRSNGLSLSVITSNLGSIANSKPEKISGDTVLRANVELLKLHGAYPSTKHERLNVNVKAKWSNLTFQQIKERRKEIDQELKEVLSEDEPAYTPKTTL